MAPTTLENSFISGLSTLKNAFIYRWSDQAWEDDMSKLKDILSGNLGDVWKRTAKERARGIAAIINTTIVLSLALEAACTARNELTPKTPVGGGDTGPRSADTSVAPIKPMMVDGSFKGANEIKKSCEQELKRKCEIFGILYTNEKGEAKISPFANDEKNNYFVWLGEDKFDPLTEKMDGGKVKWVDDGNNIYFVGIPQEGSDTELETLYYVDDNKKVWEISGPRAFHRASIVKPTQLPTETSTSTPTLAPTPSKTPTFAPSLTPIPATIGATVVKPTPIPVTATPKPDVQNGLPADWPAWIRQHPEYGWYKIDDINGGLWSTKSLPIDVCGNIRAPYRSIKDWPYDPNKPEFERGKTYVSCIGDSSGFQVAFEYRIK